MAQLPTRGNWAAQTISTSQSVALTGYVSPNGTITIASGVTLTITVDSSYPSPEHTVMYITDVRSGASRSSIFDIRPGGKLIIRGESNCPIIIEGNGDQWGEAYLHDDGLLYPPTSELNKAYTAPAVRCDGEIDFQYVIMQGIYNCSVGQAVSNLGTIRFGTTNSNYVSNLDHVTFKRNVGFCGPVIYIGGDTRGTVNMSNCSASQNEAHHISDGTSTVHNGGAIRTSGSSHMALNITNTTFDHNKSSGNGGAIYASSYNDGSMITLTGCEFSYNHSGLSGGGVLFEGNSSLQGTNRFHHNTALRNGGGISIEGYSQQTTGQAQTINFNLNSGLELDNNYSPCGAGLGINLRASVGYGVGSTINITVDGSNIHDNQASTDNGSGDAHLQGGGIYILNNLNPDNNYTVNVNLNGCKIKDNIAGMGAGVFVVKANVIGDGTGLEISGNKANVASSNLIGTTPENWNCGGGVVVQSGDLNLKNGIVKSNEALVNGGGAAVLGGTLEINGCQVGENGKSNKAVNGGGMFVKGGDFTINNGSIQYNDDTTIQNGAGIYVQGGNAYVKGGLVTNNKSQVAGAGIYVEDGNIEVSGGSIASNTATIKGGGFYVNGGNIKITGGDIQNNTATNGDGGGFYANGGTVNISNATISGNHADNGNGGGLYSAAAITVGTATSGSGATVSGNHAKKGAGFYVAGTNDVTTTIQGGSTISGNIAAEDGAGAYIASGNLSILSSDVQDNTATAGNGGAIYAASGTVDMNGASVDSNSAALNGGGFFLGPKAKITLQDGSIEKNEATNGGAIYLSDGAFFEYKTSATGDPGYIRGNTASNLGGGIYLAEGTEANQTKMQFTLNSTNLGFYNNIAGKGADDIYAYGNGTTKINIPNVQSMNLGGYSLPGATLEWWEDYKVSDSRYSEGTVQGDPSNITRYRASRDADEPIWKVPKLSTTPLSTFYEKYLCLTLGFEYGKIEIRRAGLKPNENAIYEVKFGDGSQRDIQRVVVYGSDEEGIDVDNKHWNVAKASFLPKGQYTVTEIPWTWYNDYKEESYLTKTQDISVDNGHIFNFENAHHNLTETPLHDEEFKVNILKK